MQNTNVHIPSSISRYIVSNTKDEAKAAQRASRESGAILGEVETIKFFLKLDPDLWADLESSSRISISPKEKNIMHVFRRDGWLSKAQAAVLMQMLDRARNHGLEIPSP